MDDSAYLYKLDLNKLMELYNNPNDINDKKIVLDVLRKKYPNYAEELKTSRIYADMAAMGLPLAAAVKTVGAIPAAYATYKSKARAPATGSDVRSVGGKTRRNRRSLKQRKRKHSRRRR